MRRDCVRADSASARPAERATAVYNTHPYFSNRSPACVTIWSRGIGPSTATLRLARLCRSFIMTTSGACRHRTAQRSASCAAGPPAGLQDPWSSVTLLWSDCRCGAAHIASSANHRRAHGARACLRAGPRRSTRPRRQKRPDVKGSRKTPKLRQLREIPSREPELTTRSARSQAQCHHPRSRTPLSDGPDRGRAQRTAGQPASQ